MHLKRLTFIFILLIPIQISATACTGDNTLKNAASDTPKVKTGAEVLIEQHLDELTGKRVGLVMNPTARIGQTHMLDTLMSLQVDVTALFAPEHGFRGEAGAGEVIEDGVDRETGLPVHSLYGDTRQPTVEMLSDVDLLLFDMQDVGARFYTYNATLGLLLVAAAEHRLPVWVLDRPNPAGGNYLSGWLLEEEFSSFVGMYPIPAAHGMTLGELGRMIIGEEWIDFDRKPELRVIAMEGWNRSMLWPDTGLEWFPPSPNLPTFEHALAYLGTCLIEGTTLSEGRGTDDPFLLLGSPQTVFDSDDLDQLRQRIPGADLSADEFVPESIPGKAINPKHEGERCSGIRIRVTDMQAFTPVEAGLEIFRFLMEHSPGEETNDFLYRLAGTREIDRLMELDPTAAVSELEEELGFRLDQFRELRRPYLIYE